MNSGAAQAHDKEHYHACAELTTATIRLVVRSESVVDAPATMTR